MGNRTQVLPDRHHSHQEDDRCRDSDRVPHEVHDSAVSITGGDELSQALAVVGCRPFGRRIDGERNLVDRHALDAESGPGGMQASAPPDDQPQSEARPPTASISAARSSTSRSSANGAVSVESPRPRRS